MSFMVPTLSGPPSPGACNTAHEIRDIVYGDKKGFNLTLRTFFLSSKVHTECSYIAIILYIQGVLKRKEENKRLIDNSGRERKH